MLVYLREAVEKRGSLENIKSLDEFQQAVIEGAVHRLRPRLLTEGVPVLGGLLISDEVVDIFLPVRFYWVRRTRLLKLQEVGRSGPPTTRSSVALRR